MALTYRCLIIDDESPAHKALISHISKFDELEHSGSAFNGMEAIKLLNENQYDIIFLDINMPVISGVELMELQPNRPITIVTTAYSDFALSAYQNDAIDYLLKPINSSDLRNCIQRIRDVDLQTAESNESGSGKHDDTRVHSDLIGITGLDSIIFLKIEDIMYLKADGKYTMIQTTTEHITSSKNLKVFETILPEAKFMRVHHSFLLNLKYIKKFQKEYNTLVLENGAQIPVSKSRKDLLMQRLMHV